MYDQKLLPETDLLLGMIYCYYWTGEKDLESIPNEVRENAKQTVEDIFKDYSLENLGKEDSKQKAIASIPKEPWYKRLFSWFKKK